MIKKNVLIFGSTGQIGRHLIRKLTKNNYKVICQTRNSHKAIFLKSSGSIGYIEIKEANIFDISKLEELIDNSDICVNLIGILYQDKKNTFRRIHSDFPEILAKICGKKNKKLIHISALGLKNIKDSDYAKSKILGEKNIRQFLKSATIIKPSVVFSVDDSFTTKFMSMLSLFPIFPLYYKGSTLFTPIHATDIAELIYFVINNDLYEKDIEAIGTKQISFKQILQILSKSINKNRLFVPLPYPLARLSASFLQLFPKPLLTIDQLKLLKYNNIKSENGITNFDIGCPSKIDFEEGVQKYSYNWTEGGQYSRNSGQ